MKQVATLALLLAACGQPVDAPAAEPAKPPAAAARQPQAKAFSVEGKTDRFDFDFAWPAEAAAIAPLDRRLRAEMANTKAELVGSAEAEKARRDKEGIDFHPYMSSTVYKTAGQSTRLLSLRVDAGGYAGGAHGNFAVGALLWDRRTGREIAFADLFAERANRDSLLTQRWCDALNRAREEKRGGPVGGGGLFDDCPRLDDIAIIPTDSDKDGRFDRLLLVASPYVAGPWVEGAYEIELAVTPDLVAGLSAEFGVGFET